MLQNLRSGFSSFNRDAPIAATHHQMPAHWLNHSLCGRPGSRADDGGNFTSWATISGPVFRGVKGQTEDIVPTGFQACCFFGNCSGGCKMARVQGLNWLELTSASSWQHRGEKLRGCPSRSLRSWAWA